MFSLILKSWKKNPNNVVENENIVLVSITRGVVYVTLNCKWISRKYNVIKFCPKKQWLETIFFYFIYFFIKTKIFNTCITWCMSSFCPILKPLLFLVLKMDSFCLYIHIKQIRQLNHLNKSTCDFYNKTDWLIDA
jgi:hypothetical protein